MTKEKEDTGKKSTKTAKTAVRKKSFLTDEKFRFILGILFTGFALYLLITCVSYLFWWKTDLSLADKDVLSGPDIEVKNWGGKAGHFFAKMIIANGFGYGAFFIPLIFGVIGLYLLKFPKIRPVKLIALFAFAAIIVSLILGFVFINSHAYLGSGPGGAQGYVVIRWSKAFIGMIGTGVALAFITISYLIFGLKVKPETFHFRLPSLPKFRRKVKNNVEGTVDVPVESSDGEEEEPTDEINNDISADRSDAEKNKNIEFVVRTTKQYEDEEDLPDDEEEVPETVTSGSIIRDFDDDHVAVQQSEEVPLNITRPEAEDTLPDHEVERIMGNYDPRLDLSRYKLPPVSILKEHKSESAFDNSEVFENKENIIKTLGDHKITIKSISATVGPTVTLYEIVPERGVRLARIKSLEDDIALNLSALGIRIIAPIPGRGTVGIEVPNKRPEMVSMRSLITSKAFQETKFDIALALGRTITNEPYIVDLTKMPHLLVAGATGQGKSVGINAIITSILYKKHPAEVKFVLIDPKRVELPLYMKIERHFLAKLPDEEDAIITDTQKVIKTLNSLCIEMDNRLELLNTCHTLYS